VKGIAAKNLRKRFVRVRTGMSWCHRVRNNAYLLSRVYVTPRGPRLIRLRGGFKLDYLGRWKRSRGGWANLRYA